MIFFKSHLLKDLKHGFFGSQGGFSSGIFNSLNGYALNRSTKKILDNPDSVLKNRRKILDVLNITAFDVVLPDQNHTDTILEIKQHECVDFAVADGLFTEYPNIPIGVLTADCVPIFFSDIKRTFVGVVHSGWQGTYKDIHIKMLQKLIEKGVSVNELSVVIGPSIQQWSYEVDQSFFDKFIQKSSKYRAYFQAKTDYTYYFDNAKSIYDDLSSYGISYIDWIRVDTFENKDLFFSHRRATLANTITGRNVSVITK